jgi:formate dehydrogenase major subunit
MAEPIRFSTDPEDFHYMGVNVPCQAACPAATNIPAYIRCVHEERYGRSYDINRMANILPGVLGRICSRPCEEKCRHGEPGLGNPVNICHIKRGASDFKGHEGSRHEVSPPSLARKVAVIGSGPAGLAAAHDLASIGVQVTIFEALDRPGGMLRYGIPEFRLPRKILDDEIESILALGVDLRTSTRVGEAITMEALLSSSDAVLVSAGCYDPIAMDVPGEALKNVFPGLSFMMDVCSGRPPQVGKTVLVLGAGFTAFDCARSALRLGAEDVRICLRRTEQDLRVTRDEVLETKHEGVRIESLMMSRRIMGGSTVEAVEFVRTRPGKAAETGRQEMVFIEGSDFILPADSVIVATGQRPGPFFAPGEKDPRGILRADSATFRTSVKGLYAAGDYLSGPSTVIEAIAMGRAAAGRIVEDLTGKTFREKAVRIEESRITDRKRTWDFIPRQPMPAVEPMEQRLKDPAIEVETGYTRELTAEESKRCYLCYLHYEIDIDRCIYCRYCIDVAPRDCIKLVKEIVLNEAGAVSGIVETKSWREVNAIVIDNARCIRCGECVRVCPVNCISVSKVELVEKIDAGNEESVISSGKGARRKA